MRVKAVLQSNAVLLCAVAIFQFGLFEAGLRLQGGSEAAPEFQRLFMADSTLGYRLKPGAIARFKTPEFDTTIAINAAGLRDREIGPKKPGERRIIVLGDSLVMAVQVPLRETLTSQLERLLNADAIPPAVFRVINAGVQGYGPVEEYLFYREVAATLRPDIVILTLYAGNDAVEAANSGYRLRGPGPSLPVDESLSTYERFTQWRRRAIRRSMVLQVTRLRITAAVDRFGWQRPEVDLPLRAYLPEAPPEITGGLKVMAEAVSRLDVLARKQGARLIILLLPARFQVDDEDFRRLRDGVARLGETLERDRATERFKAVLGETGVPVLDVLPALRHAAEGTAVFMRSTAHFTPLGHETIAREIQRYLVANGLVERGR
jgi:lysophospholipase L1-like esterase